MSDIVLPKMVASVTRDVALRRRTTELELCAASMFWQGCSVSYVSGHIKNYKPRLSNLLREHSVLPLLCTLTCVSPTISTLVVLSVSLFSVHILGCLVSDVCSSSWLWVTCSWK